MNKPWAHCAPSVTLVSCPSELLKHVPGDTWLEGIQANAEQVTVSGFRFQPNSSRLHTSQHAVVAYRQREACMRRSIGSAEASQTVGPGDMSLKNASSQGEWAWSREIDVIQIHLPPAVLDRTAASLYGPSFGGFTLNDEVRIRDDRLLGLVHEMVSEAEHPQPGGRMMMRALSAQLAIQLVRHHGRALPSLHLGGFAQTECLRISEYIAGHLDGDLSVGALAASMHLSPDQFTRQFKAAFNCPPHQYVLRSRLKAAQELMRDPAASTAEIAVQTGFSDQSHFHRWFKREFGQTPGHWRRVQQMH